MAYQKVELRKIRDFSEVINDTFQFIKQNIRSLLICFLGISGIFMLASAILNGLYQSQMGSIFERMFSRQSGSSEGEVTNSIFTSTYLFIGILGWLNVVAMKASLISYVKVYESKQDEAPTISEVWPVFGKYFLKVFLYSIPIALLIIVGAVFCLAPGVYLWVVLLPFEMVLVMEDETFGGAWERCFTIIKENFWQSLGIYIVAYLIYMVGTWIIGGIMTLITGGLAYFTTRDISTTIGLATSILNIFSFVFFIVWYIAAILNYTSLAEKHDGTGIMQKLDDLGSTSAHNIEEQY